MFDLHCIPCLASALWNECFYCQCCDCCVIPLPPPGRRLAPFPPSSLCYLTGCDQRGLPRPANGHSTIGTINPVPSYEECSTVDRAPVLVDVCPQSCLQACRLVQTPVGHPRRVDLSLRPMHPSASLGYRLLGFLFGSPVPSYRKVCSAVRGWGPLYCFGALLPFAHCFCGCPCF